MIRTSIIAPGKLGLRIHSNIRTFSPSLFNASRFVRPSLYSERFYSVKQTPPPNSTHSSSKGKKTKTGPSETWLAVKRFTSFTFSGVLVVGAVGVSGIVIYLIGSELFSPSGDTQLFNRAVSMVESDPTVRSLIQSNDSIVRNERFKAYGELFTHDRWTRNRPIVCNRRVDREGKVHCFLRFHLESKKKVALVHAEALEEPGKFKPKFICVYIDVPGEKRHYIIKPKLKKQERPKGLLWWNWGTGK